MVQAENLAAVLAAVNAIAQTVAGLPPVSYRKENGVRTELPPAHWLPRLLRNPSLHWSWNEVCESVIADCLLHGNAVCEIVSDAGGRVVRMEPIPWTAVDVGVTANGTVVYDVSVDSYSYGMFSAPSGRPAGNGKKRRLLASDIIHFRDRCDAGHVVAKSRIARAAEALANAKSLQEMSSTVWANGAFSSGFFSLPDILKREHRAQLKENLNSFIGSPNAGKHMLLEGDLKWHPMDTRPDLLQALDSRRFSVIEIARIMGVPPPMIQDFSHATYTNAETASKWFGSFTIVPWAKRIESAIQRSVIGNDSPLSLELDVSGLLRGNELERWNANKIAVEIGAVDADEIREQEGWGPRRTPRAPAAAAPAAPPIREPSGTA